MGPRDDTEFCQMSSQGIDERRSLPDKKVSCLVLHQERLPFAAFDRNKTHCWARNGLADGLGIGGLVLPAFDIGL